MHEVENGWTKLKELWYMHEVENGWTKLKELWYMHEVENGWTKLQTRHADVHVRNEEG